MSSTTHTGRPRSRVTVALSAMATLVPAVRTVRSDPHRALNHGDRVSGP